MRVLQAANLLVVDVSAEIVEEASSSPPTRSSHDLRAYPWRSFKSAFEPTHVERRRPSMGRNDEVITPWYAPSSMKRLPMPTAQQPRPKRDTLNLRIKPALRGLIDRAAELSGKNLTDFVLDAARVAAEDALLDRTVFTISPKAYAEFLKRLDAPPGPNERLRRSLQTP